MDYTATITVPVPPDRAAQAITDDLELWWCARTARASHGFTVHFGRSHVEFGYDPGGNKRAFSWSCQEAHMIIEDVTDAAEWVGTRLIWSIEPHHDGSQITLRHEGLGPQIACYDVCARGWQHYFEGSLSAHLKGQPASPSTE
ncbi:MAG: SRPBCC domain-containing protein [Paracoccaceae bacterium]